MRVRSHRGSHLGLVVQSVLDVVLHTCHFSIARLLANLRAQKLKRLFPIDADSYSNVHLDKLSWSTLSWSERIGNLCRYCRKEKWIAGGCHHLDVDHYSTNLRAQKLKRLFPVDADFRAKTPTWTNFHGQHAR